MKVRPRRLLVWATSAVLIVAAATVVLNRLTHTTAPKANGWALIGLAVAGLLWSWLFVVRSAMRHRDPRSA